MGSCGALRLRGVYNIHLASQNITPWLKRFIRGSRKTAGDIVRVVGEYVRAEKVRTEFQRPVSIPF